MHKAWKSENAAEIFLNKLRRQRAIEFMRNASYLKGLRNDFERARQDQKFFGKIWEEYGTNVYQLIAEACGESWDMEDEQKHAHGVSKKKEAAVNQKNHDDLVGAREKGTREREHQFQGKPEARERVVEEEQGQSSPKSSSGGKSAEEEEEAAPARRAGFYRSAGGSGCPEETQT